MNLVRILAILLIVGGVAGLAYGGFSYTKESHSADIGSLHLEVNEQKHVNVPLWIGVAAIAGGILLLVIPGRR
ncbi:MAG: hypothetical protein KAY78_06245 [Pseudomonadales bacterium]|jgi:TRAP-type C4-dicarboxylate transport system permease small subunit|nr:hypothetical protein [Cellvibrionales bacterium]MBP8030753.1 hypothetical protein [Pseudomonadales bacterium]